MGNSRLSLGARGEERCAAYLESIGYEIVEKNFRCKSGEIDIVAREGGDVVFVEVKTRRSKYAGCASEAVNRDKRRKLFSAAEVYLAEREIGEVNCRFDVAEVYFADGSPVSVELIKGAFSGEE